MAHRTLLLCAFILFAQPLSAQDKTAALLDPSKVWKVELQIGADEWKAMQPKGGGPPGFGGPPMPGGRPQGFKFGFDFPYVKGATVCDGDALKDVGVRFKGNGTFMMSASGIKRPFRLDFNRFTENGSFRGLKAISLNNNIMDPTRIREAAAYDVFRAAGVPAPRTTFVELTLDVPERFDHQLLGVYTAVEPIDKAFLKRHFKTTKGMLLKPEKLGGGLQYFGEDWKPYEEMYAPKDDPTEAEKRRLMAFARLINRADDQAFRKEIADYLDVEEFFRFLAATSYLAHYDSFIGLGHNYLIYLNPETKKFQFLPWDLDLAFGAFFPFGQPQQLADASITHPHGGDNKLIDRLLAIPERKAEYLELFKKLNGTAFDTERVTKVIRSYEATVKEPVAREEAAAKKRGPAPPGFPGFGGTMSLADFVKERSKSVSAQLAGQKSGTIPKPIGFGPPPGGGFGPPMGFKQPDPAKCVAICRKCAEQCEACAKLCLEAKDEAGAKACLSCARACLLCADLSAEKSPRAGDACRLCEQLCQDCAAVCEKSETDHGKSCAKLCRACAAACIEARR